MLGLKNGSSCWRAKSFIFTFALWLIVLNLSICSFHARPSPHATRAASVFHAGVAATSAPLASASGVPTIPYPSSCPTGSGSPLFQPISFQQHGSPLKGPEISLANVYVPLESIKPSRYHRLLSLLTLESVHNAFLFSSCGDRGTNSFLFSYPSCCL